MQNKNKQVKQGFTLVELMLAVAFLGTLLLSIAMLTMRLIDMYTKGATMRSVNSTGSAIMDDMRSHITSSSLWTDNLGDGLTKDDAKKDKKQYYRLHTFPINEDTSDEEELVDYGAFCTNSYTYVFNYQPAMLRYRDYVKSNNVPSEKNPYISVGKDKDDSSNRPYGLVRIRDPGCAQFSLFMMDEEAYNKYNATLPDEEKIPYDEDAVMQGENDFFVASEKDTTVLLDGSESDENSDLQLYDFSVMSAVQSNATNQALFDIAFVLGTTRGGININSSNNYCKKETKALSGKSYAEEIDNNSVSYCSVNRFEFVVRQTGGKE